MRLFSVLLRFFLCLCLVLNGQAMAGAAIAHYAMNAAADETTLVAGDEAAMRSCHDEGVADKGDTRTDSTEQSRQQHPFVPDCCKSSSCMGACMAHAPANITNAACDLAIVNRLPVFDTPVTSFLSRALHPAVRPPIE